MEQKREIRRILLQKRNTLTAEQCEKYSILITERILSSKQYLSADSLLIYLSYQNEVSTYDIIDHALKTGKKVFCPKVLGKGIMEFYEIFSLEDVSSGFKNIPEPKQTMCPYPPDINPLKPLMIMPMVGFDVFKNRMGYGGGFYDRYADRFPFIFRIGLAFECQKNKQELPCEKTDVKPDWIITEKTCYF